MFKDIEKRWPLVSLLLCLLVPGSLFFFPSASRLMGLGVMLLGAGVALFFTVRRHIQAHRQGKFDRPTMVRKIAVDVPGLILTMAVAIPVGGRAGQFVGRLVAETAERRWPGWGAASGTMAGLATALVAGLAAGILFRWLWGMLFRVRTMAAAPASAGGPAQGAK
jgi:uncharacterized membrane-anchored protein